MVSHAAASVRLASLLLDFESRRIFQLARRFAAIVKARSIGIASDASLGLFGIAGQRWLNDPAYRAIMTPAWTTPSLDERPDGYGDLEIAGGAYW